MQSNDSSSYPCRACGDLLPAPSDGTRCTRCGHINFFRAKAITLSLAEFGIGPANRDHAGACDLLRDLTDQRLNRARKLIVDHVPAATALLVGAIAERDDRTGAKSTLLSNAREFDVIYFNFCTQLLYLLLCEIGEVRLALLAERPMQSPLYTSLWPILSDIVSLVHLRNAAAAGLSLYAIENGNLIDNKTDAYLRTIETQANSRENERLFRALHDPLDDPGMYEAQEAVLGFSVRHCTRMMARNFTRLRKGNSVVNEGATMIVHLSSVNELDRSILDALTLMLARVQRFESPFYFDLGIPRVASLSGQLPHDAIGQNWTAYYPCYSAIAADGQSRAVLFSKHALVNALAYLSASRSQMMAQLIQRVHGEKSTRAEGVRRRAQALSARLEQRIAEQLRKVGFKAVPSLLKLRDTVLPCGEIDAIAAREKLGLTEIIVVEAKDLDFPLQKPGALDRTSEALKKGGKQLERKITWINGHWRDVVSLLGVKASNPAVLTPLLVTPRYMLPDTVTCAPIVPYNMLPSVLERLVEGNFGPKHGLAALPRILLAPGSVSN